ncbi:MAG: MarC family protein [Gammaproteobacteria bacterium]|nr:MarC family protein [Gammaproteobacteria bacterium]
MLEFFINTFIVLFVVLDPIGVAPIFAVLTQNETVAQRRAIALRGTLIAAILLFLFALGGHVLLGSLGISMDAFRIAGGVLLFLLAIDMVFARQSGLRSTTHGEESEAKQRTDISVFPLAIPLIAGPGAMTTLLLLLGEAEEQAPLIGIVLGTLALVLILHYIALIFSAQIMAILGQTGTNVVGRVLGLLLAALAIQYILDGLLHQFS